MYIRAVDKASAAAAERLATDEGITRCGVEYVGITSNQEQDAGRENAR